MGFEPPNGEDGCCLTCEDAEEGCLCYECKCRQCDHYTSDFDDGGHCDLAYSGPPEGKVFININRKEERVVVKIQPYLEPDVFRT